MTFERARALADTVLYEGYVLYPYRASSRKNCYRWAFGVLAPRSWSEAGGCEPWWLEAQIPIRGATARVEGRLRFLRQRRRRIEAPGVDGTYRPVQQLETADRTLVPWEEGEVREVPFCADWSGTGPAPRREAFSIPGVTTTETIRDGSGREIGRAVRSRRLLCGEIHVEADPVANSRSVYRFRVRVENQTPWGRPDAPRDQAVDGSLLSAHLLLSVSGGEFASLLDPPEWARTAAAACRSTGTYPVLAGEPGQSDLVLAAPIILYDHPQLAPESPGDFFDATEIDELLALRTEALSEEEKRQARGTDERAAAIIDRVESMAPEAMERLHGAIRELHVPGAAQQAVREEEDAIPPPAMAPGSRVRLRPGRRRTDAQDLLFDGCIARVEAVLEDEEGRTHLALTLEDDPGADLHRWYGRFLYYAPDELEPVAPEEE